MPARTNTFQQVVRLVYEHMASDGVEVQESSMLESRVTGDAREVDVALTSEPAKGVRVVVSIEATDRAEAVDAPSVESLLKKHEALPTDKLIIVSSSGFSAGATKTAEAGGAIPVTPQEVEADPESAVVARLGSVWAKTLALTPEKWAIWFTRPDGGEEQAAMPEGSDPAIFARDGTELSTVGQEIQKRIDADPDRLHDELGMRDRAESLDVGFRMNMYGWEIEVERDGRYEPDHLCLRWEGDDGSVQYLPISRMLVAGRCMIEVIEVALTHMQIGQAATSYGTAEIDGAGAVLVVTEDQRGQTRASLRKSDGTITKLEANLD